MTALAVGWALVTVVGLNASMTREAIEGTRLLYSFTPYEFRPLDVSLVARALGTLVMACCVFGSWLELLRLTGRAARMIHYLITDSFQYLSDPPKTMGEEKEFNPETVRFEVSSLLERSVSWFLWYVFGWLAVVTYNVLASVATVASSGGWGGH